jgi:hypothetical protein
MSFTRPSFPRLKHNLHTLLLLLLLPLSPRQS